MINKKELNQISEFLFEIPQDVQKGMLVPARIFANQKILEDVLKDNSLEQLINITKLPGIQKYAIAMPDIHEGYGFPIGGVAAFDLKEGIISPGGIGYDINCGVRLLASSFQKEEIINFAKDLARALYDEIPSGVGKIGKIKLKIKDLDLVLKNGLKQVINWGYGEEEDFKNVESNGFLENAESEVVSLEAKERGKNQLGTMGAGNHFVEIDFVEEIFSPLANNLGLFKNQIVILIHTGSRGLGHQIATDYIQKMLSHLHQTNIQLPDLELACAPFYSQAGQDYFSAMQAGANFAWANRQIITFYIRKIWKKFFGKTSNLKIIYDVAHNIAKIEEYNLPNKNGILEKRKLLVHRKGATRSFPLQPVIIPGSMGTFSWVLLGNQKSLEESFGSTCHGAGRKMSRHKAKHFISGSALKKDLEKSGIFIQEGSLSGLAEEAPQAYKDINTVIEVVSQAQIANKVARLKPLIVIKG